MTNSEGLRITDMTEADIGEVVAIGQAAFSSPWTERMFRRELQIPMSRILTARTEDGEIIGYAAFWIVADEVHLHGLAVKEDWQGQGVASALMEEMVKRARAAGAVTAFLEVRPSNEQARGLYEKLGFQICGRRPAYYTDTGEDALILCAELRKKDDKENAR